MITEINKTLQNKLLIGMIIASFMTSIGLCVYEYKKPAKQVVTVDLDHLVKGITKSIASSEVPLDKVEDMTNASLSKLDSLLVDIAADQKVIIVPKAAVIAGGRDITNEVIDLYGGAYEH